MGLWQGDLHLHNLRLRADALTRLWPQAPVSVHEGSVGSFHLKVSQIDSIDCRSIDRTSLDTGSSITDIDDH